MKHTKRISAIILAVVLAVTVCVPFTALAAPTGTTTSCDTTTTTKATTTTTTAATTRAITTATSAVGTTTTNPALPPDKGDLIIHKYVMPDVTKAGAPDDGTDQLKTVAGDPIAIDPSATPLDGITFDIYKVEVTGVVSTATYIIPASEEDGVILDNYATPTKLSSGGIDYTVTKVTSVTTGTDTRNNARTGITEAYDLDLGIYLVLEEPNTDLVSSPCVPFLVMVPMTTSDGKGWIKDVHVYPKNETINITKSADKTVADLGEPITWTIIPSIPTDIAKYKQYQVTDVLDTALRYNDSLTVTGLKTANETPGTAIPTADYTVSAPTNPDGAGGTVTITFDPTKFGDLSAYKFLRITFKTTIVSSIFDGADPLHKYNTVDNGATLNFTNRYGSTGHRDSKRPQVHTGIVVIQKTDDKNNKGLYVNGAEFQIASSEANALAGHYLKFNVITQAVVDYGDIGYDTTPAWIATTSGGTSAIPATCSFQGLADYTETNVVNTGDVMTSDKTYLSYWIVETKAPANYNLLTTPIKVTFDATHSIATATPPYSVKADVVNTKEFILPKTGGNGTILFTACGIALIGVAIVLFAVGMKKKKAKDK